MDKPRCKICGGKMQSRGVRKDTVLGIVRERSNYYCSRCKAWDYSPSRHSRPARILLLDIETLPGEYYAFNPRVEYITPDKQIKDVSISCWAAKWLFDKNVFGEVVSEKDAVDRKDGSILEGIWKLVNEAHIVVTQNGVGFDMPNLNTRWALHGYKPPSRYLNVDTLLFARKKFNFTYNRLDELGAKFGIGRKHNMNFDDWRNCVEGDAKSRKEALQKKLDYCKNDVAPLLEDVYLYMLPWMDSHPNMNVYAQNDKPCCRNCASTNLNLESEQYVTPQGLWHGWRCNVCGATGRMSGKENKIFGTKTK